MEKEIFSEQLSSIKKVKKYINTCKKKNIKTDITPFCDFVLWSDNIGKKKLSLFNDNFFFLNFNYLKIIFKECFSIIKNSNHYLNNQLQIKEKKINVIYSYCNKENFDREGNFNDTYFKINSKNTENTYWFLISLDNYLPKKNNKLVIVYRKKGLRFLYFVNYFIKTILKKNFIYNFNNTTNYSKILECLFYKVFKKKIVNLYLPYENRSHQNAVINVTKKMSKKNKIYGYFHRLPEPLQLEMIYKNKLLDKLYVTSFIQKKVFVNFFNWPNNKIFIINSFRNPSLKNRKKTIFLPYRIEDMNFYLNRLKFLLKFIKVNISGYNVSIHYLNKNSLEHNLLKNKIKKLTFSKKFKNLNTPIILGDTGSVASEMLEANSKTYHINNNNLNTFSSIMWPNIKTLKIASGIFLYKKKKYVKLINFNKKKNNFKNILVNNYF